jgi:hypothetical protein
MNNNNKIIKNYYDFIIIGSGLAGLYSAYLIKKHDPSKSILILDKEKKAWIGGRTGNETFYNNEVVTGAGVGRKNKDTLLVGLLKEFKLLVQECMIKMNYAKTIKYPVNVVKIIAYLKKKYSHKDASKTFKQFAEPLLGCEIYKSFTICSGYTDYENEDVKEVLYNYGFSDNHPGWTSLIIPWKKLVQKLIDFIGTKNVKSLHKVVKIEKVQDKSSITLFKTICETSQFYFSSKLIIATTITSLQKLLPNFSIYQQIKGQPFLRVYGKFTKESSNILKHFVPYQTIVPGPLHKIIPLKNDVYMIAYTDNEGATVLKDNIQNTLKNRKLFVNLLERSLGIEECTLDLIEIKGFYWPIGTHYYTPLHGFKNRKGFLYTAQHPEKNLLVVGEMVSMNLGWTEGALESVEAIKNELF